MFLINYYIIIIFIIISIFFLIFLNKKKEKLINNNEHFEVPGEGYSLTLNGVTAERLFHANNNIINLLHIRKTAYNSFGQIVLLNVSDKWESIPSYFDKNINNSNIRIDEAKGIITGLNPNKRYKIELIFDFYNINIGSRALWKIILKKIDKSKTISNLSGPVPDEQFDFFSPSLEAFSYQYDDMSMNSFFISEYIKDIHSLSLFMQNVNSVDVKAVTVGNSGIGSLNSSLSISLIEI